MPKKDIKVSLRASNESRKAIKKAIQTKVARPVLEQTLKYIVKSNFYAFCRFYDPEFYNDNKLYLVTVCQKFQDVSEGKIKKLAISLPPRSGKSYTASLWVAWDLGNNYLDPDSSYMRNAYGQTLAEKFSYDIKDIIKSEKYKFVFPDIKIKAGHDRIDDWGITEAKQSSYFCAGVGGAITGKGCKRAAILDDPIKNLEDALSVTILDKTWTWYLSTHKSRMETNCAEIHIATRWSKKDPIGQVLEKEPGQWETVVVAALTEDGKSFCEDVKTTEEFLALKKILDSFIWDAEYMQNPVEAKGLLFPKEELNYFSLKNLKKDKGHAAGFTDTADEGTDYLSSVSAFITGQNVYITDVIYTQDPIEVTQPTVAQLLIDTAQKKHLIESNSGGKGFALKIKELIKNKSRCIVTWEQETRNKETRILMNSGQIKQYFYFRNDYAAGSDYDVFMRHLTSYLKMGKKQQDGAPDSLSGLCDFLFKPVTVRFLTN